MKPRRSVFRCMWFERTRGEGEPSWWTTLSIYPVWRRRNFTSKAVSVDVRLTEIFSTRGRPPSRVLSVDLHRRIQSCMEVETCSPRETRSIRHRPGVGGSFMEAARVAAGPSPRRRALTTQAQRRRLGLREKKGECVAIFTTSAARPLHRDGPQEYSAQIQYVAAS